MGVWEGGKVDGGLCVRMGAGGGGGVGDKEGFGS